MKIIIKYQSNFPYTFAILTIVLNFNNVFVWQQWCHCERNLEFLHQFEYWNPAGGSTHNHFKSVNTRRSILGSVCQKKISIEFSWTKRARESLKIWDRKMKIESLDKQDTDRQTDISTHWAPDGVTKNIQTHFDNEACCICCMLAWHWSDRIGKVSF